MYQIFCYSGIIVPIVKDKSGDLASVENYRPITLSPVTYFGYLSINKCDAFWSN